MKKKKTKTTAKTKEKIIPFHHAPQILQTL